MAQIFNLLEARIDSMSRRRFFRNAIGGSVALAAWAAGVRSAYAYCSATIGGAPPYSHCNPPCPDGLRPVFCCCLAYANNCAGGVCNCANCGRPGDVWAWTCVDCDGKSWACLECPCGNCSAANYAGTRPVAWLRKNRIGPP